MGLDVIPRHIHDRFQVEERRHACAILATDFADELADLIGCLDQFYFLRSEVIVGGGAKTTIARRFDDYLYDRGWKENRSQLEVTLNGTTRRAETHLIDLCKGRVACEVQWNSKDGVFSRDLGAFRLLHEMDVISVGIIITRSNELRTLFAGLGWFRDKDGMWKQVKEKYGSSTTHWAKLLARTDAGEGGACPLLLVGIRPACYRDDMAEEPIIVSEPKE